MVKGIHETQAGDELGHRLITPKLLKRVARRLAVDRAGGRATMSIRPRATMLKRPIALLGVQR